VVLVLLCLFHLAQEVLEGQGFGVFFSPAQVEFCFGPDSLDFPLDILAALPLYFLSLSLIESGLRGLSGVAILRVICRDLYQIVRI
jgi:hypothetical protein